MNVCLFITCFNYIFYLFEAYTLVSIFPAFRTDGAAGHPLPRPGQHLQHRHHQHPQGAHTERQCFSEEEIICLF